MISIRTPQGSRGLGISATDARRMALAAQGLGRRRARPERGSPRMPGLVQLRSVASTVHALQLDTVNVLVRAHYLPAFSRLGPYPTEALDRLVNVRHELIELNAHQASFVPVALEPLLRWRAPRGHRHWTLVRERLDRERPGYVEAVEQEVIDRGPLTLSDLTDPGRRPKPKPHELLVRRRDGQPYAESSLLWGRASDGKAVLDGLLHEGRLALAGRRGFERLYDLHERVVPAEIRSQPTPAEADAKRGLVELAARALGVATVRDLADYFNLKVTETRTAARELADEGVLLPANVESWRDPAFVHAEAKAPRSIDACAILSPFDSLTWSRDRTRRLFGFEFSFEIYVPEPKRKYGYYVLPFLLGDTLVARIDLKADRKRGVLVVPGAFAETGIDRGAVAAELAAQLHLLAGWLRLDDIQIGGRGDLARPLAQAVR